MNDPHTSPDNQPERIVDEHKLVSVPESSPHNTTEGSEYLDDALRMVDQPLMNNVDQPSTNNEEIKESKCD